MPEERWDVSKKNNYNKLQFDKILNTTMNKI
jgi:hypothetical protein